MRCSQVIRETDRRGGVLTSVTLLLAILGASWFLWMLQSGVDAAEFTRVQTSDVRLDVGAAWADPSWEPLVKERVARLADFDCEDAAAAEQIARELRTLPFVRSVVETQVLWPDGLRFKIELRSPIACVKVGSEFLGIANDGMLLPGAWPAPAACGQGYLPLIALDDGTTDRAQAGQILWNDAIADALSVASAMWAELEGEDLARLGRSIIDARRARLASVEEPGTLIFLENSRRILFGRAPSTREPGELPAAVKWLHVANALMCLPAGPPREPGGAPTLRNGDVDWELVEVRWDHAAMLPRGNVANARVPVKSLKTPKPKLPTANKPASAKLGRVH